MIKLWVIYKDDKIIAWSTKQMSIDEVEVEVTQEQYQSLINQVEEDN